MSNISEIGPSKGNLRRISELANWAYFPNHLRSEIPGRFQIADRLTPQIMNSLRRGLNKKLREGSEIAVISFSGDDDYKLHVFSKNEYARYATLNRIVPAEEKRTGSFLTRFITTNPDKNETIFEVRDAKGNATVTSLKWDNEQNPRRRFAIMTHSDRHWSVVLDFRLEEQEGPPSWKISSHIFEY